jgi:hypothetical protein
MRLCPDVIFISLNTSPDMHFHCTLCDVTDYRQLCDILSVVLELNIPWRTVFILLIEGNTLQVLVKKKTFVFQSKRSDWNTFFAQCHQIANGLLTHVYGTDTVALDLLRSHVGSISCEWGSE